MSTSCHGLLETFVRCLRESDCIKVHTPTSGVLQLYDVHLHKKEYLTCVKGLLDSSCFFRLLAMCADTYGMDNSPVQLG